jgi:hypothetical protein
LTFLGLNLIYSRLATWHSQQNIDKGALIFFQHHLIYMSKLLNTMLNAFGAPTKIKHVANPIISQRQMRNAHNDTHYTTIKNLLQFFYDILVLCILPRNIQTFAKVIFKLLSLNVSIDGKPSNPLAR